ncbi:MAG: MATE family efflux transporter [Chitinophagaceae bacterium]
MANGIITNDLQVTISNRQILKIAFPISFAIFVPQINFVTNNIFLGGLGEESLAAAGITGVAYLIFSAIGIGLNNGLQALIARRAGENKVEEIGKLFSQGVLISLAIAAIGILFIYFAGSFFLHISLKSEILQAKCIDFLRIRIWGLPFLYIYQMRNALLVGTNQSRFLIAGSLAEAITNIFFDYGFIYGKLGLPEIGFNGAAYASIIAEFTGMIVVFVVIHYKGIGKRFNLFGQFKVDRIIVTQILKQSAPLIFQYAISIITWNFFYILVEHHGSRALAISTTMRNIFGFFGVFTWAFGATTATMVSNIIGQDMKDKVPWLIKKIAYVSTAFGIVFFCLLNLFPGVFLSVFAQSDDFITDAIPVVRVVSSALVIMSFSSVWMNAVIGTGNSKVSLVIETFTVVLYIIYVYFVLEVMQMSIVIGWMSEWVYWLSMFGLSWWYIRSGRWKKKII